MDDLTPDDLDHLRRCLVLAGEALDAGNAPFGSVLVGPDGTVLREERNEEGTGDQTGTPSSSCIGARPSGGDGAGPGAVTTRHAVRRP